MNAKIDRLNNNLNTSLVLDNILICQIYPCDKTGLGYEGTSSSKECTRFKSFNEEIKGEFRNDTT